MSRTLKERQESIAPVRARARALADGIALVVAQMLDAAPAGLRGRAAAMLETDVAAMKRELTPKAGDE